MSGRIGLTWISDWSRTFAPQPEIQAYFEGVALRYQLDKSTSFNTEIVSARWDDRELLWFVETIDLPTQTRRVWSCNVVSFRNSRSRERGRKGLILGKLISAAGAFTIPKKAEIPNVDAFQGEEYAQSQVSKYSKIVLWSQ